MTQVLIRGAGVSPAQKTTLFRCPLDAAFAHLGWSRWECEVPVYELEANAARLESFAPLSGGTRYRLHLPSLTLPPAAEHLLANRALAGPHKYVLDDDEAAACVADLPARVLAAASEFDVATAESPLASWAHCLTAVATGQPPAPGEPTAPARIVKALEGAGYTASADGAGVKATLVLSGRFAEVAIEPLEPTGLHLVLELASGQVPDATASARRLLAAEVNRRLLLARFSEAEPGKLIAEVRLTMARVHEAWLLAAMESLSAAAELALRPLAALADPALATHVLGLERG
jgi:hypothetical protein